MIVIRYLDLDIKLYVVYLQFFKSEEFGKLNPSRKIPVLKDGDFILSESVAICQYLILKSGTEEPLLGISIEEKALVIHRLCYSFGIFFQKLCNIATPLYIGETKEIDDCKKKAVEHELGILEKFLSRNEWVATDYVTLADLSLITIVMS